MAVDLAHFQTPNRDQSPSAQVPTLEGCMICVYDLEDAYTCMQARQH